jgi:hypothetical protein
MWKILVWAFSRIPRDGEDLKDPMAEGQGLEGWSDTRERAYRVLKQDVRDGIGVAFVAMLLRCGAGGRREGEDVGRALEVIGDLIKCGGRAERADAVLLLERLMSGVGASLCGGGGGERRKVVLGFSRELVDGSLVGKARRELVIRPATTSIGDIEPLSEAEALLFWKELSEIWTLGVQDFFLQSDDDLPVGIS